MLREAQVADAPRTVPCMPLAQLGRIPDFGIAQSQKRTAEGLHASPHFAQPELSSHLAAGLSWHGNWLSDGDEGVSFQYYGVSSQ